MTSIGFICPTYKARELDAYTRISLASFFATTPSAVAIVVDDGSADWNREYEQSLEQLAAQYTNVSIKFIHFPKNGGLTRSWNAGLTLANSLKLDYAIAGNNDVIFTTNWYAGMLHALNNGYHLVGPLSNAPGITAKGAQQIERYISNFKVTDDRDKLNSYAAELYNAQFGSVIERPINGFFQLASMDSWVKGKYDSIHFYRPVNPFTSKGYVNTTPLMTLNEDELQKRWRDKHMKSAVVLSSFIFHYRAVTRGDRYRRGNWYRLR